MNAPPAIRVLPMSQDEFDGISRDALQRNFFLRDLPNRQGRYWFRKHGLDAAPGTVVLFQYDKAIVASATLVDFERFDGVDSEGYCGYFDFDPSSIRTFEPVGANQMHRIWHKFRRFSHVRHELSPERYAMFVSQLTGVQPSTIAEHILRAVARIVGANKRMTFSRVDIRVAAGVTRKKWTASYSPTFQGMRADQPGGAPVQSIRHQSVFEQVERGLHRLTAHGRSLMPTLDVDDGPHRNDVERESAHLEKGHYFDPKNTRDERKKRRREIAQRRGQPAFRRKLLLAYEGKCAVTGCTAKQALEAAHILPYSGDKSDHVTNGILVRSDIHTLFDLDLIGIHPTKHTIVLARAIRGTSYDDFAGDKTFLPTDTGKRPNAEALKRRWREFATGTAL
jgi:hypothetical protein